MAELQWSDLFVRGSIVQLRRRIWRARTTLTAEDLGIEETPDVKQALSWGCHRLAPRAALNPIWVFANGAEKEVDAHSLNFPIVTGARFVPDESVPKLLHTLGQIKVHFDEAVEEFLQSYVLVKSQMLPTIRQALRDACRTEASADRAFERIREEYPSLDQLRRKFGLSWNTYEISGAKNKANLDLAEEEAEQVRETLSSMVGQLRSELREKIGEVVGVAARGGRLSAASMKSATAVLDRIQGLNILGDAGLNAQIAAFRQVVAGSNLDKLGPEFQHSLTDIQAELSRSIKDAVRNAESTLTAVGKRKMKL